jgi:hypothetical protein
MLCYAMLDKWGIEKEPLRQCLMAASRKVWPRGAIHDPASEKSWQCCA